jgi:hypothetical protein
MINVGAVSGNIAMPARHAASEPLSPGISKTRGRNTSKAPKADE